jgi:hypothetical protein
MHASVRCATTRNQVLLRIRTGLATDFFVMNLQVGHPSADLASPSVLAQHLITGSSVQSRLYLTNPMVSLEVCVMEGNRITL